MKVSCSMSAFKGDLDKGLETAKSLGFEYVDLLLIGGFEQIIPEELVSDFDTVSGNVKSLLEKHGLKCSAFNMAFPNPYQREDEGMNKTRIEQVEAAVKLMHVLGVDRGSFFPGGNWPAQEREWTEVCEQEAITINEILDIAKRENVTICIEPHANTPFESFEQVTGLLETVPELKVAYDPSHFEMQGLTLEKMKPVIEKSVHVHVRDAAEGQMMMPTGEGTVDFKGLINMLKAHGYDGFIAVEVLGKEGIDAVSEVSKLKKVIEDLL